MRRSSAAGSSSLAVIAAGIRNMRQAANFVWFSSKSNTHYQLSQIDPRPTNLADPYFIVAFGSPVLQWHFDVAQADPARRL